MQQVIPNICSKFQNPRCSCSWGIFDTNVPMYYNGVRDGKKQNGKKKAKINLSISIFFPTVKVYTKFEDFGSPRSGEICDRNFYLHTHRHTHTHKHCYWKDKNYKTIYPLYTSYTGGIKRFPLIFSAITQPVCLAHGLSISFHSLSDLAK